MKNRKVVGNSQHEYEEGKSGLINVIDFYDEINVWIDVDVVYLNLSKAFSTVSYRLL